MMVGLHWVNKYLIEIEESRDIYYGFLYPLYFNLISSNYKI